MATRLYTHTSAQCSSANVGLALMLAPVIEDSHLHAASILKISEHDETGLVLQATPTSAKKGSVW